MQTIQENSKDLQFNCEDNTDELILSEYGTAGKVFALGVKGSKKFRQQTENFLVNYGVINMSVHMVRPSAYHPIFNNFGYFVVDIMKLEFALVDWFRVKYWLDNRDKGLCWDDIINGAGRYYYKPQAEKYFNNIKRENFMKYNKDREVHFYYSKYNK